MSIEHVKASPLGRHSDYIDTYTPSLLFPIPRKEKRDEIGVPDPLPFHGVDIWNAYELSWLDPKGKPHVAMATFYIPSESPCIIESKSFKLYLNSFNQHQFSDENEVKALLKKDISLATSANVEVDLLPVTALAFADDSTWKGICLDDIDTTITDYHINPDLLVTESNPVEEALYSHLLKSNCLVTGQPDWGSVYINYAGNQIQHESLLKYVISYRNHNEFHEQCVERIFMDLMRQCHPKKLTVYARYTRRGGLDINPFRSNFEKPYENARLARQ